MLFQLIFWTMLSVVYHGINLMSWEDILPQLTVGDLTYIPGFVFDHWLQSIYDWYYPPMIVFNSIVDLLVHWTNANYQLFEDGSYIISGCLPWATCALGG